MPDLIRNALEAAWALEDDRAYEQERQDRFDELAPSGATWSGARPGSERPRATSGGRNGGNAPDHSRRQPVAGSAPSAQGREPRSTLVAATPRPKSDRMDAVSEQADAMDGWTPAPSRPSSCPSVTSIAGRPAGRGVVA